MGSPGRVHALHWTRQTVPIVTTLPRKGLTRIAPS
jgi:hypothetical protein